MKKLAWVKFWSIKRRSKLIFLATFEVEDASSHTVIGQPYDIVEYLLNGVEAQGLSRYEQTTWTTIYLRRIIPILESSFYDPTTTKASFTEELDCFAIIKKSGA